MYGPSTSFPSNFNNPSTNNAQHSYQTIPSSLLQNQQELHQAVLNLYRSNNTAYYNNPLLTPNPSLQKILYEQQLLQNNLSGLDNIPDPRNLNPQSSISEKTPSVNSNIEGVIKVPLLVTEETKEVKENTYSDEELMHPPKVLVNFLNC